MSTLEEQIRSKLASLQPTQTSIQSTSLWAMFHQKNYKTVVKVWVDEVLKSSSEQILTLMYLCNDIVQTSRKKTQNYINEFEEQLPNVMAHVNKNLKDRKRLTRVFDVWLERKLYSPEFIQKLSNPVTKATPQVNIDHPLVKYLIKLSNEPELLAPFHEEDIPVDQIEQTLQDCENKKNDLIAQNQEREEYINELLNEVEQQRRIYDLVMSSISTWEQRIDNLRALKKRDGGDLDLDEPKSKNQKIENPGAWYDDDEDPSIDQFLNQ